MTYYILSKLNRRGQQAKCIKCARLHLISSFQSAVGVVGYDLDYDLGLCLCGGYCFDKMKIFVTQNLCYDWFAATYAAETPRGIPNVLGELWE